MNNADNGSVLWTYSMPAATSGIPAMYEAAGKQYLVVAISGPDFPAELIAYTVAP